MITIDQVKGKTGLTFIHNEATYSNTNNKIRVRQTGKVKIWKREPDHFSIPVKYGLYQSFYIDNSNCHNWSILK